MGLVCFRNWSIRLPWRYKQRLLYPLQLEELTRVCVHAVCVCVCMSHVCVCICVYVTCMCVYVYVCVCHMCVCVRMCVYVTCVCRSMCMFVCVCMCVCVSLFGRTHSYSCGSTHVGVHVSWCGYDHIWVCGWAYLYMVL